MKISPYYLAGLIDGDGSFQLQINVRKSKNSEIRSIRLNPRVAIGFRHGQEEEKVLRDILRDCGFGKVYLINKGAENAKVVFMTTNIKDCISATEFVIDHLRIKRDKAEKFLEMCLKIKEGMKRRYSGRFWEGEKIYTKGEMIEMVTVAVTLNRGRQGRRFRNTLGRDLNYYLKAIDEIYD